MKAWMLRMAGAALFVSLAGPAQAEDEGGFRLPNLNPFSKSEKSEPRRATGRVSDDSSLWPFGSKPAGNTRPVSTGRSVPRRAEPSMTTKVTQGTKNFFSKTYDVLTPWDNNDPPPPPRYGASKPKQKKGFDWDVLNLFGDDEPEQEITSVNEWLALPRPDTTKRR